MYMYSTTWQSQIKSHRETVPRRRLELVLQGDRLHVALSGLGPHADGRHLVQENLHLNSADSPSPTYRNVTQRNKTCEKLRQMQRRNQTFLASYNNNLCPNFEATLFAHKVHDIYRYDARVSHPSPASSACGKKRQLLYDDNYIEVRQQQQ